MGFRTGAYCTIWEIKPFSDVVTKGRVSISKKNKQTGEYETDFSGFVGFLGTTAAKKAASLKEKDRIRLKDVDVTTKYDKEKKTAYTNFNVYSFDSPSELDKAAAPASDNTEPDNNGEPTEDDLPF